MYATRSTSRARSTPRPRRRPGNRRRQLGWAILRIAHFMISMLATAARERRRRRWPTSPRHYGPWIIVATVIVPLIVAAVTNWLSRTPSRADRRTTTHVAARARDQPPLVGAGRSARGAVGQARLGRADRHRLHPDLRLCYNIWSSFAFPFYLDLQYSKDEVAFASKIFGIFMTIIGISLGGYLFLRIGRFPTILIGAILPVFGNFVYADLAEGGHNIDAVAHAAVPRPAGVALRLRRADDTPAARRSATRTSLPASPGGVRRLCLGHRQQEVHRGPICVAVVADIPHRLARPRHRRRGVRHLRLRHGVSAGPRRPGLFAVLFVLLEGMRVAAAARRRAGSQRRPSVDDAAAKPAR